MPVKVIGVETALQTEWFTIRRYLYGERDAPPFREYFVHEAPDSAMCVCAINGRMLLVEQYRFPLRRVALDFPAGAIESDDRDPEQAALRELREETGVRASRARKLLTLDRDPGFSSGKMHVFLALEIDGRDPLSDTNIRVRELEPGQILQAVRDGELSCAYCVATALWLARELRW